MNNLLEQNIVIADGTDKSRLFKFNATHPFANAIQTLFEKEGSRVGDVFQAIKASGGDIGKHILSMWIYGSVARREDRADSDIDIGLITTSNHLTEVVETVRENLREASERLIFLPNVVGLSLADVKRLTRDRDPWWESCVGEAIVLIGQHPEDFRTDG